MTKKYVAIKNKKTGLFWYGFGLNNEKEQTFLDLGYTSYPDVPEDSATWFDLNDLNDKKYIDLNLTEDHEMVFIPKEKYIDMED